MKESLRVLKECADIQAKKGEDYQNPNSRVKQAQYYPNGCRTIHDIMQGKMLRMQSVMEAMENDDYAANFESLEDKYTASFQVHFDKAFQLIHTLFHSL